MTPPLTVIVPSHRRVDLLAECLRSLAQHSPAGTQVIVVDDGSPHESVSRMSRDILTCEVIRFEKSRGFCVAANAGIAQARAPIVELLNDDATVTAGWAESALAAFDDPAIAAVAPLVLRWPGNAIDSAGDGYDPGGFAWPIGRGRLMSSDNKWSGRGPCEPPFNLSAEVAGASACAAFYRRDAVLAAGGFPESFGAYFEDVDLACRLRRNGGLIVHVALSRVVHRGSATHGAPRGRLLERQSCNEERVFWRNTAGTPSELLRHSAVLAGKGLRRLAEGRLTPWLCGRCRAWAMEANHACHR